MPLSVMYESLKNTIIIPPSDSLTEEIISHLETDEKDYSQNLVIFPGKRPSHFIRKMLGMREKSSFIPPVILSMDEFVNFIYERRLGLLRRKLETIDSVAILYNIQKDSLLDDFFPLGLNIFKAIEELYIERINRQIVKDIEPITEEHIPEQIVKRLQSLAFFYEKFYEEISKKEYSTRSIRYRTVSERIDKENLNDFRKVIIAGFFALTKSENDLFKKLLTWKNTLFIFQDGPGIKKTLDKLGIAIKTKKRILKPRVHFYKTPDTHAQVFGVSAIIKSIIEKGEPLDENTLIMLPSSETMFPLLHQSMALLNEGDYNISLGYPLHRTPVYSFFNNLMKLITSADSDRFYIRDYLRFVLHPYTKNIYHNNNSDITRILFHTIETGLTKNRAKNFITLHEIEDMAAKSSVKGRIEIDGYNAAIHLKIIHNNTIRKFLSFDNTGDFAAKSIEVLTYIYDHSTASLHPFFHPFAKAFIESLHIIFKSLMKDISFKETSGYFNLLRRYIMTRRIPFEGTPLKGLQVLGFLETRSLKFNRLFILDANEDVIPDVRKEDSLLTFKAREILGLSTYMDRERLISYHFDTLISGAEEVHIFFIEKDKKERSRFVERLIWSMQKADKKKDAVEYVKSIEYSIDFKDTGPSPIHKSGKTIEFLKGYVYSASSMDAYLKCPLLFYYRYVLNLSEREEITADIEMSDTGRFVHNLLLRYFSTRRGHRLTEKDISCSEMESLADRMFEDQYGKSISGAVYLLKNQINRRLRDFLKHYQIPILKEQPIIITNLEYNIRKHIDSFNLNGTIDRIEKRGNLISIIDYKLSGSDSYVKVDFNRLDPEDSATWSQAIGSIQLPFYLMLYSEHTGKKIEEINGMYLLLGKSFIDKNIEMSLFSKAEEVNERYNILKRIIFSLLKEIADPGQPFKPAANRKKICPGCSFHYICG